MVNVLSDEERNALLELYETRLNELGHSAETVGWKDRATQILRFEELTRDLDLNGKTILDLGCGMGDFYNFLKDSGITGFRYVGVDLSPKFIKACQQRLHDSDAVFYCDDIYAFEPSEPIDFTFCSGALSFKVENNQALAEQVLKKAFEYSTEGIAFNILSSYVDFTLDKNFHYQPETIFSYCKNHLSRWVRLAHDYPLYEFTVQVLKGPR